jgi:hypothetical protein
VVSEPVSNRPEPEFSTLERLNHEMGRDVRFYVQFVTVYQQKSMSRREGDSFITIEEWMIVRQRFHQRGRFLNNCVVVADLGTEYSRLEEPAVSQTMYPTVALNQIVMDLEDFADCQINSCQLLSQFLI